MSKQKLKITNWPAYNNALRQRGSLTVWPDESAIAAWADNAQPEGRGRPLHYTYHSPYDEKCVQPAAPGFTGLR